MRRSTAPALMRLFPSLFLLLAIIIPVTGVLAQAALKLSIHYIQAAPQTTKNAYDVNAFVSVLDDSNYPLPNLTISNFSAFEDSQPISIKAVSDAKDAPINLILLFDISGSMSTGGLQQSKVAGSKFLQKLGLNDQVAIISFSDVVTQVTDFSSNFQSAQDHLQNLQAVPNGGTCLYDAAYKSVELSNTLPPGRRAIVLLTDGKDETLNGKVCSSYTVDDVVAKAAPGAGNVPIYTLGLGKDVDENVLKRIAGLTGGEYLSSPDNSQLGGMFDKLYQQLKEQYQITYESNGAPGPHNLTVAVEVGTVKDQSTRVFSLPYIPTRIKIDSPTTGQSVGGQLQISASVLGGKDTFGAVRFDVGGQPVSTVTAEPFTLQLDLSKYPSGNLDIAAVALGKDGKELARDNVTVIIPAAGTNPAASQGTTPSTSFAFPKLEGNTGITIIIIVIVAILVLGLIIYLVVGRKKNKSAGSNSTGISLAEATMDGFSLDSGAAQAFLTVLFSDDSNQIGKKISISRQTTRLGRDMGKNDVVFEKDRPVSREHVTISMNPDGKFVLAEVARKGSDQQITPPTYGTFVNENRVSESVTLASGDQIRLGSRLKLLFEIPQDNSSAGESTTDFEIPSDDSTTDA